MADVIEPMPSINQSPDPHHLNHHTHHRYASNGSFTNGGDSTPIGAPPTGRGSKSSTAKFLYNPFRKTNKQRLRRFLSLNNLRSQMNQFIDQNVINSRWNLYHNHHSKSKVQVNGTDSGVSSAGCSDCSSSTSSTNSPSSLESSITTKKKDITKLIKHHNKRILKFAPTGAGGLSPALSEVKSCTEINFRVIQLRWLPASTHLEHLARVAPLTADYLVISSTAETIPLTMNGTVKMTENGTESPTTEEPQTETFKIGYIGFKDEAECVSFFNKRDRIEINGAKVPVLFADVRFIKESMVGHRRLMMTSSVDLSSLTNTILNNAKLAAKNGNAGGFVSRIPRRLSSHSASSQNLNHI